MRVDQATFRGLPAEASIGEEASGESAIFRGWDSLRRQRLSENVLWRISFFFMERYNTPQLIKAK